MFRCVFHFSVRLSPQPLGLFVKETEDLEMEGLYREFELPFVPFVGLVVDAGTGQFGPVAKVIWHESSKLFLLLVNDDFPSQLNRASSDGHGLPKNSILDMYRRRGWKLVDRDALPEWLK